MTPTSGTVVRRHACPSQCNMSESANPTSSHVSADVVTWRHRSWPADSAVAACHRTASVEGAGDRDVWSEPRLMVAPAAHASSRPDATTSSRLALPVTGTSYRRQPAPPATSAFDAPVLAGGCLGVTSADAPGVADPTVISAAESAAAAGSRIIRPTVMFISFFSDQACS